MSTRASKWFGTWVGSDGKPLNIVAVVALSGETLQTPITNLRNTDKSFSEQKLSNLICKVVVCARVTESRGQDTPIHITVEVSTYINTLSTETFHNSLPLLLSFSPSLSHTDAELRQGEKERNIYILYTCIFRLACRGKKQNNKSARRAALNLRTETSLSDDCIYSSTL